MKHMLWTKSGVFFPFFSFLLDRYFNNDFKAVCRVLYSARYLYNAYASNYL